MSELPLGYRWFESANSGTRSFWSTAVAIIAISREFFMNSERCALSQHARIKRRGKTREAHRSEASLLRHDVVLAGPFQRAGGGDDGRGRLYGARFAPTILVIALREHYSAHYR
jgi:hypothetical protein